MRNKAMLDLATLKIGTKVRVCGYHRLQQDSAYRQKLLAMGLTPNTEFVLTRIAPLGDPIEICVRHSSLIVRKNEIAQLALELVASV
jgi:ferrous iron transport protein A